MAVKETTTWTYDENGNLESTSGLPTGAPTEAGEETKLWVFKTGNHEVWVRWAAGKNGPEVVNSAVVEQPSFGRVSVPFFAMDRRSA